MTTKADYAGRRLDLLAYHGATAAGEVLLQETLFVPGEGGRITAGLQKLCQRVVILLETELGSLPFYPDRGTRFITEARFGSWRTPTDVLSSASRALLDVQRQISAEQLPADPLDERLRSVNAVSAALADGEATVYIRITSQQPGATALLPIAVGL